VSEALRIREGVRGAMRVARQPDAARTLPEPQIRSAPGQEAATHNMRGIGLGERGEFSTALAAFDRAIACCPDGFAGAWSNRGNCLQELGRNGEALASYNRAIEIDPGDAMAWRGRGDVLRYLHEWGAALASYDRAIALLPTFPPSHVGRGQALTQLLRLDAAVGAFDTALALDPNNAYASGHKAVAFLLNGRFEEGWRSFELRPVRFHERAGFDFARPRWSGDEPLAGKTIALLAEADLVDFGMGDLIQLCRYVGLVATRGARVVLEAPAPLARLLASLDGVSQIVTPGEPVPECDFWLPILSLPFAFGTTLETIPASIPYLRAAPDRVLYWGERLGSRTKPRVGVVWAGGHKPWRGLTENRDMPLAKFSPLRDVDAEFYSLQKGLLAEAELPALEAQGWNGPTILDFTRELHDFAETAALVENLDLVIAVDTAPLHLAGALGKPVWLLNRCDTCWRWMLDRDDSPWYPTMRIYRQASPGDWDGVMARVREALTRSGCAG
jgi:Flp pilus assembly protein TadD